MKEPSKHMLNGIIIILIAIIIAITFTINYSSINKVRVHCYEKVYAGRLIYYEKNYPRTKEENESRAAAWAGVKCLTK